MRKLIASVFLFTVSSTTYAWGVVEQAALLALTGGYIMGRSSVEYAPQPAYGYYPPATTITYSTGPARAYQHYNYQPRKYCYYIPLYDAYGRRVSSTRQCEYVY